MKLAPSDSQPARHGGTTIILIAIAAGVLLGGSFPADRFPLVFETFHFLSKAFIQLIKGLIIPLLMSTLIVGIAQTGDLKLVGRMGGKALLYFELVTTIALGIGLVVANVMKPGASLPLDVAAHPSALATKLPSGFDIALHMFPSNLFAHAAAGDILPVVVFATLFGIALTRAGESGKVVLSFAEGVAATMIRYTEMVMRLTPIGVFAAMAYNVSHMAAGGGTNGLSGWPAVWNLVGAYARLVGSLYLALALLFALVFVPVLLVLRVRVRAFLRAVRDPVLTAFTTASSEAALPKLLAAMESFGVPKRIASFVIPAGYSFNLDGSTLYLVLASLTIAQAAHVELTLSQQLIMMLSLMLTSKGVAGVPRATLVVIAATCSSFGLPGEAGVAMLLAVDELMDMGRTAINVMGNGLASVVIARWEGAFTPGADEAQSS
ncbi:MAG: Proton/glutamate symport protein [Myxococcaceae bacterium]|nr:Proton/glutamate symport protein [Myxococcaceae bacterium]